MMRTVFAFFSGAEPGCFHCNLNSGMCVCVCVWGGGGGGGRENDRLLSHSQSQTSAETCQDPSQKCSDQHAPYSVFCQMSGYPTGLEFSHIQIFRKNGMMSFLTTPNNTGYLSLCNPMSPIAIVTISEVATVTHTHAGLGGSVGCAVRLETRKSRVQPPPRSATFFRGD